MVEKQVVMKAFMASIAILLSYSASAQINGTGAPLVGSWSYSTSRLEKTYHIYPDGSYTGTVLIIFNSLHPGCTTVAYATEAGVIRMRGEKIFFEEKSSKSTSRDNCRVQANWEKILPLRTETYTWRLEKDGADIWLILTEADGMITRYRRHTE